MRIGAEKSGISRRKCNANFLDRETPSSNFITFIANRDARQAPCHVPFIGQPVCQPD